MLKRMRSFLVAAMLMVIATVSAQVTTSSMSGKVTAQDEPIIGATVVAIHEPSGTRYGTVTNISGQFNLQGMRTGGPYKVEVSYVGYQTAIYKGVNLSLGEVYTLNVVLKESSELLDEVIVTAQKTVEKMGTVTNVSERQLTTLPTINRSITDFTKLSPYAGGSNSFAGRDGRYNTITVDGAALNNNFGLSTNNLPGGDAQPISLDAIDEISVNVSPYSVTYSNFTGASINAVTKSGTNELKGTVYTYQKPKNFIGKSINDVDVPNVESYKSSLYGFTLGAPIIKNKLFFFVNGELENSTSPGILWTPSQEEGGSGDNQNHISRT
nr:carboxypeptidase regulatory-like domain-containing protein [Bacteroides ovatus]